MVVVVLGEALAVRMPWWGVLRQNSVATMTAPLGAGLWQEVAVRLVRAVSRGSPLPPT